MENSVYLIFLLSNALQLQHYILCILMPMTAFGNNMNYNHEMSN